MKTDWGIFEKTFSLIQILLGITIISVIIWSVNINISQIFERTDYTWKDISILKLIKNHHFFTFLGLMGIIGGIGWFKYKTSGWLLSFMFWFLLGFSTTLVAMKFKQQEPSVIRANEEYLIYYSTILVSFFVAILLVLKTFWNKYNPTKKSLIIFGIILLTFIVDKIILTE
jgi:hypothetical protein